MCAHAGSTLRAARSPSAYGSNDLDASALMIPLVGFLPPEDPRVAGTTAAIERELMENGLVHRYRGSRAPAVDGLPPGEGVFLPCTYWLCDNYALAGRHDEARKLFERLLSIRNDLGLLAEEYDPRRRRLVGNFPQAFSHVSLINTALNLTRQVGPAHDGERRKAGLGARGSGLGVGVRGSGGVRATNVASAFRRKSAGSRELKSES